MNTLKSACVVMATCIALLLPALPRAWSDEPATTQPAKTAQAATSRPDPEWTAKQQDIRKLMDLTNAGNMGVQVASQMIDQMRSTWPQVPNQFWDDFKRDMNPGTLVDLVVPIYDHHFTHDDIKQMISFYDSPVGRKVTAESGAIMRESMDVGAEWGALLSQQIMDRLRDHGYTKA